VRTGSSKLAVALLATIAAAALASPAGAAQRCTAPGAKTVLQDSEARIFSVKGKGAVKRRYYGCLLSGKPRLLTSDVLPKSSEDTHTTNASFRLTGRWVAWVETSFSDFGAGEFGRSIDARALESGHRQVSQDVGDYAGVTALALRADGAVAWILATGGAYREVDAVDSTSKVPTPLAYARGVDPKALTFDPTSITWTQDGAPRSAPVR
jgi:hypothetical protein